MKTNEQKIADLNKFASEILAKKMVPTGTLGRVADQDSGLVKFREERTVMTPSSNLISAVNPVETGMPAPAGEDMEGEFEEKIVPHLGAPGKQNFWVEGPAEPL